MITVINPVRAATLFWRLAVLRRQLARAGQEIGLLGQIAETVAKDPDLTFALERACRALDHVVEELTPTEDNVDCAVTKEA